jgi:hypothetical protein
MMETVSTIGMSVFSVPGTGGYPNELLATGQIGCFAIGDDGDFEAGDAKAYTVNALPGTTPIEVAHYANNGISFVAPNTVNDAGAGLVTILAADTIVIKGSALNDGVYTVLAGGVAGTFTTVQNTIVNSGAGPYVSLYKRAAHANIIVADNRTGLTWSQRTSNGERVGAASTGLLNWYDVATRFIIYNAANTISVIMPGNTFRITGGAALTQFHVGDCLHAVGFANAVNLLPFYRILSVTPNVGNLDIVVQPQQNDPMVAEGAVGDTLYLNCRSIYNYAAGANLAGLGGYTDWREPDDTELASLREMEAPTAVPDAIAFPGWPAVSFTHSGTCPSSTVSSGYINFATGTFYNQTAKTSVCITALVRLGT